MNKRIVVLLTVVPLMVLMVFFVATAAIAQSPRGEQQRHGACGKVTDIPPTVNLPFGCTT